MEKGQKQGWRCIFCIVSQSCQPYSRFCKYPAKSRSAPLSNRICQLSVVSVNDRVGSGVWQLAS